MPKLLGPGQGGGCRRCGRRGWGAGSGAGAVTGVRVPPVVLPERIDNWSLASAEQRLVKTGGRLVKHARCCRPLLAEGRLTGPLFESMARRIAALPATGSAERREPSGARPG